MRPSSSPTNSLSSSGSACRGRSIYIFVVVDGLNEWVEAGYLMISVHGHRSVTALTLGRFQVMNCWGWFTEPQVSLRSHCCTWTASQSALHPYHWLNHLCWLLSRFSGSGTFLLLKERLPVIHPFHLGGLLLLPIPLSL